MSRAVVGALLLVPLHFVMARRPSCSRIEAVGWGVLAVVAVAENAWALAHTTVGEESPLIWILPSVAALATATAWFMAVGRERGHSST